MDSSALSNPTEEDFQLEGENVEVEEVISHKDQLSLQIGGVNQSVASLLFGVKMNLKKQNDFLEISQLWKSPSPALAITSFLTIIGLLFIGGILNYGDIGPTIPFFFDSINKQFIPVDKSMIFISGIILALIEIVIIRFIISIARIDRRLSIVMAWIIFFLNILIITAISQFYTIII